jgi:hypothetical protein
VYVSDFAYFCAVEHIASVFSTFLLRVLRIPKHRGFGVQSPFAYDFIREVIYGDGEYYAFRELRAERRAAFRSACGNSLKTDLMLFRLANFVHPTTIFAPAARMDISRRYLSEGCTSAAVYVYRDVDDFCRMLPLVSSIGMLYIDSSQDGVRIFKAALPLLTSHSLLVIKNIRGTSMMRSCWQTVKNDNHVSLTFDTGMFGIALFDHSYCTHHYDC